LSDALRVVAVLLLVAGNAFFVIGEYAMVTARRSVLAPLAEERSAARAALRLMDDPVRVISTTQVGITAIGILTGAVGEPVVRDLLGDAVPHWVSFLVAFGVVTYLSVVFGELVPKALVLERTERLAMLVAPPVELIAKLVGPVASVLQGSAALVLRPFGITEVRAGESIRSADELRALVDEAEGAGVIPRAQEELLHNVFDFADREAADVMVPAHDVAWLDAGLGARAALERMGEQPHTRYPVGRGSLDRLAGRVTVHDVLAAVREDPAKPLEAIVKDAVVVPETKDLGALLRELRERREQMAIVLDEYGTVAGIVTMEDVLEEIVGEIEDEYDLPDARIERVGERTLRVAGSMTIDDFNEETGAGFSTDGPRTLAGLVIETLGRAADEGDVVHAAGATLRVVTTDALRIERLEVELPSDVVDKVGD
jgi:putative hemolysin